MPDIDVREAGPGHYEVVVREGSSTTTHTVSLTEGTRDELGVGDVDARLLVEESFRFLLEREPKESILGHFDLTVIGRYFPEYPDEIRRRLPRG